MLAASVMLGVVGGLALSPGSVEHQGYGEDGWILMVIRDHFAGTIGCSILTLNGHIRFQPDVPTAVPMTIPGVNP